MTHEEIYEYLTKAENWVILTDDINNNNSNFRYDPVNMGTNNYFASLPINDDTTRIAIKINDYWHRKYDVSTFIKWGNVKGLKYGNTNNEADENYIFYNDKANKKIYDEYWKEVFQ